jgi:Na+/H+ antiporter NhaD/arsenite permease-like protein
MADIEAVSLFAVVLFFALANLPLLWMRPSHGEQRLWRRLGVQRLRRSITRRRDPKQRDRAGATIETARTNIRWHVVLGLVFAALVLHPQLRTWPLRVFRYALLTGCIAYFVGSVVQRQKIVIASNRSVRGTE